MACPPRFGAERPRRSGADETTLANPCRHSLSKNESDALRMGRPYLADQTHFLISRDQLFIQLKGLVQFEL